MTKNTTEPVSDAMVDIYLALRAMNAKSAAHPVVATAPLTRGADVDPKRVIKPGKRLRAWHRDNRWEISGKQSDSLRSYARALAATNFDGGVNAAGAARAWIDAKKAT